MEKYYDGNKILQLKDKNGKKPAIRVISTNRSAGKTTYFHKLLVNRFLKKKEQFILLYRCKYELEDVAEKFSKEIVDLFFPNITFESETKSGNSYAVITTRLGEEKEKEVCGYAIALNAYVNIKKCSHIFRKCTTMYLDEFEVEGNGYLKDEIMKFISVYKSVSRGNGDQNRYVEVILSGNNVSSLNPYYCALGINKLLKRDTKYIKGDGYVMERVVNQSAIETYKETSFSRAISECDSAINNSGEFMEDSYFNVGDIDLRGCTYFFTLLSKNAYGVYQSGHAIYVTRKVDLTYPIAFHCGEPTKNIKSSPLTGKSSMVAYLRDSYLRGNMFFSDLIAKSDMIYCIHF